MQTEILSDATLAAAVAAVLVLIKCSYSSAGLPGVSMKLKAGDSVLQVIGLELVEVDLKWGVPVDVPAMTDVFMYADETGNLDYNLAGGGSKYFGIGTATWHGDPAEHLWQAERMRFGHASDGIECAKGYHAKDDTRRTRTEVYQIIKDQAPRFDTTFLAKGKAYPSVRVRGQTYLYKLA